MNRLFFAACIGFTVFTCLALPVPAATTSKNLAIQVTSGQVPPPSGGISYSQWSNYPQSDTFFPIVLFKENPNRTLPGTAYPDVAAAASAVGINIILALDNGGLNWPAGNCSGDTNGYLARIKAAGLLLIPDINPSGAATADSISSISCLASSMGASANIIGWNMGDEPQTGTCSTWPMSAIPGQVSTLAGQDATRPILLNSTDFPMGGGVCSGNLNQAYTQAIHISSFDLYPIINPYLPHYTSAPNDALWTQGWSVLQFRTIGGLTKPHWAFIEAGSDALAFAEQNGSSCPPGNTVGQICSNGNENRATLEQVNAEVWNSLLNGANGIEWFCHDSQGIAWCLGDGGSAQALAAAQNIKYIDETVRSFAQQLNAATAGLCTMITDNTFAAHTSTCSDGVLTVSTGTSSIPGGGMVKSFQGAHYLFAQTDRNGQANLTFTLTGDAGKTATVVYDSNAHYDPAHSTVGSSFTLDGAGRFSDTFGANGHNYQPKIYRIQ